MLNTATPVFPAIRQLRKCLENRLRDLAVVRDQAVPQADPVENIFGTRATREEQELM